MGLDVIGRVLEVVSGLPLDRLFRQRIFRKMGMKDTVPWLPQLSVVVICQMKCQRSPAYLSDKMQVGEDRSK